MRVTFELPDDHGPVSVVGDFNGWNAVANPLRHRDGHRDGYRDVTVVLAAGRRYRFRYLADDGHWFNDGQADSYEANEYGEEDSIVDLSDPRR